MVLMKEWTINLQFSSGYLIFPKKQFESHDYISELWSLFFFFGETRL